MSAEPRPESATGVPSPAARLASDSSVCAHCADQLAMDALQGAFDAAIRTRQEALERGGVLYDLVEAREAYAASDTWSETSRDGLQRPVPIESKDAFRREQGAKLKALLEPVRSSLSFSQLLSGHSSKDAWPTIDLRDIGGTPPGEWTVINSRGFSYPTSSFQGWVIPRSPAPTWTNLSHGNRLGHRLNYSNDSHSDSDGFGSRYSSRLGVSAHGPSAGQLEIYADCVEESGFASCVDYDNAGWSDLRVEVSSRLRLMVRGSEVDARTTLLKIHDQVPDNMFYRPYPNGRPPIVLHATIPAPKAASFRIECELSNFAMANVNDVNVAALTFAGLWRVDRIGYRFVP
jgi:hypothetical protein